MNNTTIIISTEKTVDLQLDNFSITCPIAAGHFMIPVKPLCEIIQVDYKHQYRQLKFDDYFSQLYKIAYTVGGDGKQREMVCLPIYEVNEWLCSIGKNNRSEESLRLQSRLLFLLRENRLKYIQKLKSNDFVSKIQENTQEKKRIEKQISLLQQQEAESELIKQKEELERKIAESSVRREIESLIEKKRKADQKVKYLQRKIVASTTQLSIFNGHK